MYEQLLQDMAGGAVGGALVTIIAGYLMLMLILGLALYVYTSLTMMLTARKLKTEDDWLAWIPLVGKPLLMSKMAQMHWWPVLLIIGAFIPVVGVFFALALAVFTYIWWWKLTEARGMPGWIVLLSIIPFIGQLWGLVLWGLLAWKD